MANVNKSSPKARVDTVDRYAPKQYGIYLGEIMSAQDVSLSGRVLVFIPNLSVDRYDVNSYFSCQWSSPFAGTVNSRSVGDNIPEPEDSMQSYGMWMVPPDPGNFVLVAFIDGDTATPVVISTLMPDKLNHMLPGMAANRTYASAEIPLPTVEKNKRVADVDHDDTTRPLHYEITEAITRQGLIRDARRGPGFSTARRESPSEVFGILTPGPQDPANPDYRLGGHQLIMDDNLNSRLVRIRTAMGQQLLLDDTTGSIYAINRDGQAWFELDADGNFTLFGEGSINLRARGDFNLRADGDVNIEAGGDLKLKAAGDTSSRGENGSYVGPATMGSEPPGYGGTVMIEAARHINTLASLDQYHEARAGNWHMSAGADVHVLGRTLHVLGERDVNLTASGTLSAGANGSLLFTARGDVVTQGSAIRLNSGGASANTAEQASPAAEIPTASTEDQPRAKPEFQRNPENALPTSGRRAGEPDQVKTIVSAYPTAEPYAGHTRYDPTSEDIGTIDRDERLIESVPRGSAGVTDSTGAFLPSDVDTPSGFALARGPVGAEGVPVINQTVGVRSLRNLPDTFQIVGDGIPLSNFQTPAAKDLLQTPAANRAVDSLSAAVGSIAGQARDLVGRALAGAGHIMTSAQTALGAIAVLPSGRVAEDFSGAALEGLSSALQELRSSPDVASTVSSLAERGYQVQADGASVLVRDSRGNIAVDASRGTGPIGTDLVARGDLAAASDTVSRYVTAPLSDNQLAALSSFAQHVGEDNFARSGIPEAVNSGDYADVPRLMNAWTVGTVGAAGNRPARREDYAGRRRWEGELFSTPDSIPVPPAPPRANFDQLATALRLAKRDSIQ